MNPYYDRFDSCVWRLPLKELNGYVALVGVEGSVHMDPLDSATVAWEPPLSYGLRWQPEEAPVIPTEDYVVEFAGGTPPLL